MSNMVRGVKMLKMDDIEEFPIQEGIDQGGDRMVRIGTIGEGSCFLHSVLRAWSQIYTGKTQKERRELVKCVRQQLAYYFTFENFMELDGGNYASNLLQIEATQAIMIGEEVPEDTDEQSHFLTYPDGDYYHKIWSHLPENYEELLVSLNHNTREFMDDIQALYQVLYKLLRLRLHDCSTWIGTELFEHLSNAFKLDIYVIDSVTRQLSEKGRVGCDTRYLSRPSVVVLLLGSKGTEGEVVEGMHFELLGRREEDGEITTFFESNDHLIQDFYTQLCVSK